tara:strand:- start:12993 stop:14189 length:1197 start_codon:yes stop_codon:yes gene_type:complete
MIQVRFKNTHFFSVLFILTLFISCAFVNIIEEEKTIIVGANSTTEYLPLLKNKKVAIVANQTSVIFKQNKEYSHIVDSLLSHQINIVKVFAPEHGFRGKADAGEHVNNHTDTKTGIPIISLFGKNRKPQPEVLEGIDIVIFDIQDVGVRFYTYISTMSNVMEACAEKGIPVIVLDRPNPNGHYVDGPTLEIAHKSFVGIHPIPLVYGMTIGEYALMVNGEGLLKNNIKCDLTVINLKNYTHNSEYNLPIRPSPNLPNDISINLYPSLGFFEGTPVNAGRGTEFQFQRYGSTDFPTSNLTYTPQPNFGSKHPKQEGKTCNGVDLTKEKRLSEVNISWLVDAFQKSSNKEKFFGNTFTVHAGNTTLQKQIENGVSPEEIQNSWKPEVEKFKKIRSEYLIY